MEQIETLYLYLGETDCIICGREIFLEPEGYALPMYEGRVDYRSSVDFPVCKECFDKHEQKRL